MLRFPRLDLPGLIALPNRHRSRKARHFPLAPPPLLRHCLLLGIKRPVGRKSFVPFQITPLCPRSRRPASDPFFFPLSSGGVFRLHRHEKFHTPLAHPNSFFPPLKKSIFGDQGFYSRHSDCCDPPLPPSTIPLFPLDSCVI